jgi:hypothetical protein
MSDLGFRAGVCVVLFQIELITISIAAKRRTQVIGNVE